MNNSLRPTIDYTNKDYASLREAMLELAKEKLPEWTDHSPNDLGVVLLELFAYMGDILMYYQDRIANESYLETAVERRSVVNMLRLIGYEMRPPMPATAELTLLFNEPDDAQKDTLIKIPNGAQFDTSADLTTEVISFRYLRSEMKWDLRDLPSVSLDGKFFRRIERLPVVQVDRSNENEYIGTTDNSAAQRLPLADSPLLEDTLQIWLTDEGGNGERWQHRNTLLYSRAADTHFMVRRNEQDIAFVEFGDGRHGAIPPPGRRVTASYIVGGGKKGNVPAHTIVNAVSNIEHLNTVSNPSPASGGDDAESIEQASRRGPQLFRAQDRAVTARDYEAHAKAFGVGKARARAPSWNHIELYVAPVGGGWPTDTLKEDLRTYLDNKRMLGTIIDIRDPDYIGVCLEGTLAIDPYRFSEQVQQQVNDSLLSLLAFDNVDFEYKLYLSKIYEVIESVDGVVSVYIKRMASLHRTEALPEDGLLAFQWSEIPTLQPIQWLDLKDGEWRWSTPC